MRQALSPAGWRTAHALEALVYAKGNPELALSYAESQGHRWEDRELVVESLKAATTSSGAADFGDQAVKVAAGFVEAMRDQSVPARLEGMLPVPFRVRVLVNSSGVIVQEVAEGAPIPVLKGGWSIVTLTPRKFAGIDVRSLELLRAPAGSAALLADLAAATATAENTAFCDPTVAGSIFYGATTFGSAGSSAAQIDTTLRLMLETVRGSHLPGAAWIMSPGSAVFLATVRGSGGDRAFPDVTAQGGELLGLPVLLTDAMAPDDGSPASRYVGLVQSSSIIYASGGAVSIEVSDQAALQMADNPTNDVTTPTATTLVSLWDAGAVGVKAEIQRAWSIRAGGSAYVLVAW